MTVNGKIDDPRIERIERKGIGEGARISARVSQALTICRTGEWGCGVCGQDAPFPDEEAILFLLRNHDGDRITMADREDCEEERDCYPCKGWRNIYDKDGEVILACTECAGEMGRAQEEVIERRKRKK